MILLVGSADHYLIEKAKQYSSNPVLITEQNWNVITDVGYTGIEEFFDKSLFLKLLDHADKIIYYPRDYDSDSNEVKKRKYLEFLLLLVNQTKPVINLLPNLVSDDLISKKSANFLDLKDTRKSNDRQLWAAGCSYTYGMGVQLNERYPSLISKELNIPVSVLAYPGSSIAWAADQIIRSDIKKDDIVVWGLTNKQRINWYIDQKNQNILLSAYDNLFFQFPKNLNSQFPKKLLLDIDNSLYQALTHIHQVINFCQKTQAKLLIIGLLVDTEDYGYLYSIPEYFHYYHTNFNFSNKTEGIFMLDKGSDGIHPGPIQHREYANSIINQLRVRKWV